MNSKPFTPAFANQPPVDFALEENRQAMSEALSAVKRRLGRDCPLVIGGQTIETSQKLASRDPSHPEQIVGQFSLADKQHVEQAVADRARLFAREHRAGVARPREVEDATDQPERTPLDGARQAGLGGTARHPAARPPPGPPARDRGPR